MDCTFCLDCVYACPHDNVALDHAAAGRASCGPIRAAPGIGFFSQRKDLAALALVFTFGALLNAFGMVSPVYALESWLAAPDGDDARGAGAGRSSSCCCWSSSPLLLLGLAAWLTRRAAGTREPLLPLVDPLRLRPGPPRLRDLAGALQLPLVHRPAHRHPGDAERARRRRPAAARPPALAACAASPRRSSIRWSWASSRWACSARCWSPGGSRSARFRARAGRPSSPGPGSASSSGPPRIWLLAQPMEMRGMAS